jgi:hypothetical protein
VVRATTTNSGKHDRGAEAAPSQQENRACAISLLHAISRRLSSSGVSYTFNA